MEVEITNLILKNGLSMVVMALIVMMLIGVVKIFTKGIVTQKIVTDNQKKWLSKMYLGLALVLSYAVVLVYHGLILKIDCWTFDAIRDAGIVWTVTSPLYQLYKQFGGRKLLTTVAALVVNLFKGKNKEVDSVIDIVMNILNDDAPLLTDAQKEVIQASLADALDKKKQTETKN